MRRFLQRSARAVVWMMIPLTFVGSVPRMGCICANGDHKLFCQRRVSSSDDPSTCCYGHVKSRSGVVHHGTAKSCCAAVCPSRLAHGARHIDAQHPCRPVLDIPQLLTKAKVEFNVADDAGQFLAALEIIAPQSVLPDAAGEFARGRELPPLDLVIAHQVFLI